MFIIGASNIYKTNLIQAIRKFLKVFFALLKKESFS
jgi:hypothetical protein